jgi:hypothetical protein
MHHYKSFERLLVARCGTSLATHRQIGELRRAGLATAADNAAALLPLADEANALHQQLGNPSAFAVHLGNAEQEQSANVGHDTHIDEAHETARVEEKINKMTVRTIKADDFAQLVRVLRTQTELMRATALTGASQALEKYMVLNMSETTEEMQMSLFGGLIRLFQEIMVVVVAYMQVDCFIRRELPACRRVRSAPKRSARVRSCSRL